MQRNPSLDPDILDGKQQRSPFRLPSWGVALGVLALLLLSVAGIFLGSGGMSARSVLDALLGRADDLTTVLVVDRRVPRVLLAVAVGAALGVAGALMQALTRNPLADPGLLGVNAGAFFAVVLSVSLVGVADIGSFLWFAFLGAGATTVAVVLLGSRRRGTDGPVRLVLAGVALGAVLNGVSYSITLLQPAVFDRIRFWQAGTLQGRTWSTLWVLIPLAVGLLLAVLLTRGLNALSLGEDLAVSLGVNLLLVRAGTVVAVTLLCGAATAAVGPILFLGLMVPFLARGLVGPDQRKVVPLCALIGALLFLGADVLGRFLAHAEMPVGVVTAFLGAPALILLARRGRESRP